MIDTSIVGAWAGQANSSNGFEIDVIIAIARGFTIDGLLPALNTSKRSPASARSKPSAICERAELPVQGIKNALFHKYLANDDPKELGESNRRPIAGLFAGMRVPLSSIFYSCQ